MFGHKAKNSIDSLIGATTKIEGNVMFKGGMHIDGHIKGNVIAEPGEASMLIISEHARVEGEVRAAHLVINGEITGTVCSYELLELQPKARIRGDVYYKALEMHGGALVAGKLSHEPPVEQVLQLTAPKLAASNA
jgi:cytoskeletal protein CcmA (bactofilin family)